MSDIQKARDVLKKWREPLNGLNQFRILRDDSEVWITRADGRDTAADARLIVGTAGNPDLLDAIDMELQYGTDAPNGTTKRIAAAIIAADERMSA